MNFHSAVGVALRDLKSHPVALVVATVLLGCLAIFSVLFPAESRGAVRVWIDSRTFNHCFFVLPISLFLVWWRREALDSIPIAPDVRGVFLLGALTLVWVVAAFVGVLEVQQFVVLTMLQATLFTILGLPLYRKLTAPFLYLYFLVPSGEFLVPALQEFTAWFAVHGLRILGIPVFSTGALIEIPAGNFAIAEACAGLRFLVAAVAFGVFFAVLTYRSIWRRLAFIALSIVVPIIANGFRALGLIAVAEWIGSPTAAMADHILYGWIFFSLVLVALIFIGQTFSDRENERDFPGTAAKCAHVNGGIPLRRLSFVGALCVLVVICAPLASAFFDRSQTIMLPGVGPRVASSWRRLDEVPQWRPVIASPNRVFLDRFDRGAYRVDRFVALYSQQGRQNNLLRSENRDADEKVWTFNSAQAGRVQVNGKIFPIRVSIWIQGTHRRVVWSFFVVNGDPVVSAWRAKWDVFRAYVGGQRCASAYVAISTEESEDGSTPNLLADFLSANEPLSTYLCKSVRDQPPEQARKAPNSRPRTAK